MNIREGQTISFVEKENFIVKDNFGQEVAQIFFRINVVFLLLLLDEIFLTMRV